jgi:SAM-dependent methyltransferase
MVAGATALAAWELSESLTLALFSGTVAAIVLASFLHLPSSWRVVNTIIPISAALSLAATLPGWIFAVPLLGLLATYAPAFWTRVPYYPTSKAAYPLILAEIPPNAPFTFVDIGCGLGDLLIFLKKHRPLGRFYGVEIGLAPYMVSKCKALTQGDGRISIGFQDLNKLSLEEFDYVYAFLSPAAMTKVWQKACLEMKPGSTFITNAFEVSAPATYRVEIKDARRSSLFVHKITDSKAASRKSQGQAN